MEGLDRTAANMTDLLKERVTDNKNKIKGKMERDMIQLDRHDNIET